MSWRGASTASTPRPSRILWIGEDRILLLEQDDLDVERVRLYPLVGEAG